MTAQLACGHRGERLAARGTIEDGKAIPLHQCRHFDAPCSTSIPTIEGHRCCKTCHVNPFAVHQKGIAIRVEKQGCRKKCQWAWVVLVDGVVKASGNEDTEEAARAEAEEEAREIQALIE